MKVSFQKYTNQGKFLLVLETPSDVLKLVTFCHARFFYSLHRNSKFTILKIIYRQALLHTKGTTINDLGAEDVTLQHQHSAKL